MPGGLAHSPMLLALIAAVTAYVARHPPTRARFAQLGLEYAYLVWPHPTGPLFEAAWSLPSIGQGADRTRLLLVGAPVAMAVVAAFVRSPRPVVASWAIVWVPGLWLIVCANLALLGVFKYAAAVLPTALLSTAGGRQWVDLALPLGISFFTFQQIGYLLDRRRGQADAGPTRLYWLFVLFFPQMIAGPILRHRDIVPQFERVRGWPRIHLDLAVGATLFTIGLFKKVVFGDGLAALADPFFAEGAAASLGAADAWLGATIFALALYFDFSGYCDMALGVARLFGIRLPINFDSPFKADDILVFWRRWHVTLGRFVNRYVFQPLAILGARAASRRRVGR